MKIGYIRVSTDKQNVERQHNLLSSYNLDKIYEEKITGKSKERPKIKEMLGYVREGDTIYIESYSRLARNTKDLIAIVEELNKKNVNLVSLKENVDTSTPAGKLVFTLFAGIAEFERELILERTREGRAEARKRGITGGRKPIDKEKIDQALLLYDNKALNIKDICRMTGISKATLYNYINRRKEEAK